MSLINYVIACYLGERRVKPPDNHIQKHLQQLSWLKHNLSQITLVFAGDSLNIQETDLIKVLKKENYALSYSSFNLAYETYKDQFTHYIFMEDDYVLILDNFDQIMLDEFNNVDNCGLMCSLVSKVAPHFSYVTNGITSSAVLAVLKEKQISLHHNDFSDPYSNQHQIQFANSFRQAGFVIADFSDRFQSPFMEYTGTLLYNYDYKLQENDPRPIIIQPIQCLNS